MYTNMSFKKTSRLFAIVILLMTLVFTFGGIETEARIGSGGSGGDSQSRLRDAVDNAISEERYVSETGDTIRGSDLVKKGITTSEFEKLTSKEKQRLIDDMSNAVTRQQERDLETGTTNTPITGDTVTNWLQELQQQPGVGSRLLQNITAQVRPDYVTGNRIFEPFAGPLNTVIALAVILIMVFLTLTFVFDLSYLNIPMFQSIVVTQMSEKGGSGGSRYVNYFVGREAIQAVEDSENDSTGKSKNPNGIYLKKRIFGLAFLGICLLYLVQGEIFKLVGMLMDLLGGFLN